MIAWRAVCRGACQETRLVAWMRMMGADSVDYHRQTVLDRQDDHPGATIAYYAERGESPLLWRGGPAAGLGLAGHVTVEHYEDIFGPGGARHPVTGERLVSTKRPGLELVVSAHKSVAELGVIGRAEDMHRILDAERDGTLAYLEQLTQQRGGRRGRAATPTPTSGLLYAVTRHATSRAGDPCPHDHVLIANLVEMLDDRGGWKAADTAMWREHLHAATAYGRLCSARVAVELGYGIVADDGPSGRLGHWAIAGIPDEVMAIHSKRAAQIDDAIGSPTESSYRQRAIAARRTRSAKRHEQVTDLMARWQAEIEVGPCTIAGIVADIERDQHQRITAELDDRDLDRLAAQLLAPESQLAADKVFTRRDAIVAATPQLFGLDPAIVDRLVDRVLVHPDAVELEPFGGVRERVWAPRCVMDTEHAVEERAWSRHHARATLPVAPVVVSEAIAATEASLGLLLTPSQRATVRGICESNRSLDVVVGIAGSGKTTALDAVRLAHEHHGYRVIGAATSGQAARTVGRDAHAESHTVASLLARLHRGSLTLDRRTLLVVDESGMTDDHDLHRLLDHTTRAHAKLVLVGDPRQLSAVGPGGGLEALVRRFDACVWQLTDNVRQTDLTEREALAELRHGDIRCAVDWLARHDRVVAGTDRAETIGAVIDGWLADTVDGADTVILAWRRANVDSLNHLARHAYAERAWLTGPEIIAPGGRPYRHGDRIVTLGPYAGLTVTSETGTIEQVHPDLGALTVRFDDGRQVLLPPAYTADNRLAYGYAITVHRSQGATVDTTHYLEDGGGRELAYVALSRARHRSTVYTHADDLDTALDDLTAGWTIERRQQWISDRTSPLDPAYVPEHSRDQGHELDLF
jgi:conjugative relaxase-like TrwC/TraI family protein